MSSFPGLKGRLCFPADGMGNARFIPALIVAASLAVGAAAGQVADGGGISAASSLGDAEKSLRLIQAAHALELSGQQDEALMDYTEAIESHRLDRDTQARALFSRGLLLDGMSRLGDAVQDYSAALSLSPNFAAALNNRANIYRREGRFTEAGRDYRASLAAGNPQSQYSYYGLGQIAEAGGKVGQAKTFYTKAATADPSFVLAKERLAALEQPEPIHLRPPSLKSARAEDSAGRPPLQPPVPAQTVQLRPPALKPARRETTGGGPSLRPAIAASSAAETARSEPPRAPLPTAYDRKSPALKPALDQASPLGAQIQLGAWRSEAEAGEGWNRALKQAGDVLEGFSPHIVAVDLPGRGRYYRLRIAADKEGSKTLCSVLVAKGLNCFLARD